MSQPTPPLVPFVPAADPTSLASSNFTSSGILNNIFSLVLQMTTALQNVAASQANRLNFLTEWQTAYTNALAQIHTFTIGDGTFISGTRSIDGEVRSELNRLNSNLIQTMQNRQSVVSDNAKGLQSNVNQSNDAVNQQSDLGTAILQELGTLLSSIYH